MNAIVNHPGDDPHTDCTRDAMPGLPRSTRGELAVSVKNSIERLVGVLNEQQASDEFRLWLDMMARFHRYSWGNCLLIAVGKPDATLVAGFTTWKKLGRSVRKGEKTIRILAPCPVRRRRLETATDAADKDEEVPTVYFKVACVFDVSQTEGAELPEFDVPEVHADAEHLLRAAEQVAFGRGIVVKYSSLGQGHYGISRGGLVEVDPSHSTGQQAKTLFHEVVHLCCEVGYVS
jgi:antirestriction protein ArdC